MKETDLTQVAAKMFSQFNYPVQHIYRKEERRGRSATRHKSITLSLISLPHREHGISTRVQSKCKKHGGYVASSEKLGHKKTTDAANKENINQETHSVQTRDAGDTEEGSYTLKCLETGNRKQGNKRDR